MPEKMSIGTGKAALADIARVKLGKTVLTTVWDMPAKFPESRTKPRRSHDSHTLVVSALITAPTFGAGHEKCRTTAWFLAAG